MRVPRDERNYPGQGGPVRLVFYMGFEYSHTPDSGATTAIKPSDGLDTTDTNKPAPTQTEAAAS